MTLISGVVRSPIRGLTSNKGVGALVLRDRATNQPLTSRATGQYLTSRST